MSAFDAVAFDPGAFDDSVPASPPGKPRAFRPGRTVEFPYRSAVLRADPAFEYARRHEPFYEFSNGRNFNGDTSKVGAYHFEPVNVRASLQGVAATGLIHNLTPQTDTFGASPILGGIPGNGRVGNMTVTVAMPPRSAPTYLIFGF